MARERKKNLGEMGINVEGKKKNQGDEDEW
jgi:hypothetical protein